jgi:hypothetical protein
MEKICSVDKMMEISALGFKQFDHISILSILGTVTGPLPAAINLGNIGYLLLSRQTKRKILPYHRTLWSCFFHALLGLPCHSLAGSLDRILS